MSVSCSLPTYPMVVDFDSRCRCTTNASRPLLSHSRPVLVPGFGFLDDGSVVSFFAGARLHLFNQSRCSLVMVCYDNVLCLLHAALAETIRMSMFRRPIPHSDQVRLELFPAAPKKHSKHFAICCLEIMSCLEVPKILQFSSISSRPSTSNFQFSRSGPSHLLVYFILFCLL